MDLKLLGKLGFDVDPTDPEMVMKYSEEELKRIKATINRPVIAIPALPKSFDKTLILVKSASKFLPDVPVVIFDFGISYQKHLQVRKGTRNFSSN